MKRWPVFMLVAICLACGPIYSRNLPWRTYDPDTSQNAGGSKCVSAPTSIDLTFDRLQQKQTQREAVCATHERFGNGSGPFDLHVIEFDDQGRPWNYGAQEETIQRIARARTDSDVLLVFFIHGWFNNARVCNGKLVCFREMLHLFSLAEERFAASAGHKPRKVIGVYAGWRGGTLKPKGLNFLTFFGRKSTAHTIGENVTATAVISRLATIVHSPGDRADRSSIVFIGHSFGGALLYSAVGNRFSRAIGDALATPGKRRIEGVGDLVLLVNAAIEASPYHELRRFATRETFSDEQLPVLLTLSSEKDRPNQIMFPIGQTFAFSQKAARSRQQWLSMIESIGTFREYQTHRLIVTERPPSGPGVGGDCGCSTPIRAFAAKLLDKLEPSYAALRRTPTDQPLAGLAARRDFTYSRLEPTTDISPHSPFMTIRVDADIMGGHSDIFGIGMMDFVANFFIQHEVKRHAIRARNGGL